MLDSYRRMPIFLFHLERTDSGRFSLVGLGSLGIGIGYHRLLTHRATNAEVDVDKVFSDCLRTLALEGGPIAWVATHRVHHAETTKKVTHTRHKARPCGLTWADSDRTTMHKQCKELLPFVRSSERQVHLVSPSALGPLAVLHCALCYRRLGPFYCGEVLATVVGLHGHLARKLATHIGVRGGL